MKAGTSIAGVLAALVLAASTAFAHGGHDDRLKVRLGADELRFEMSAPASALAVFDADEDGTVRVEEILAQRRKLERWIDERVQVLGADRVHPATFSDLPIVDLDRLGPRDPVAHVRIVRSHAIEPGGGSLLLAIDPELRGGRRPYVIWGNDALRSGVLPAASRGLTIPRAGSNDGASGTKTPASSPLTSRSCEAPGREVCAARGGTPFPRRAPTG